MFSSFPHKTIATLLGTVVLAQSAFGATVTAVQTQSIAQNDVIANTWFQQANDRLVPFTVSSGNVGIGIASPTRKLHVQDGVILVDGTDPRIAFYGPDINYAVYRNGTSMFLNSSGYSYLSAAAGVGFITNSITRLFVDVSGNVGIGTSSPSAKLEVNGQVKITDGTQGAGKVLTSDASGLATWQTVSGGGSAFTGYTLNFLVDNILRKNGTIFLKSTNGGANVPSIALGLNAGSSEGGGDGYVYVGAYAGEQNTSGDWNTYIGQQAGRYNTSGGSNTILGAWAGNNAAFLGSSNTIIGMWAGGSLTSGSNNIIIGENGTNGSQITTGSNNILIGTRIVAPTPSGSNQLNIGNWIYGNNGNIGIGTSSPGAKLDVNGSININNGFGVQFGGSGSALLSIHPGGQADQFGSPMPAKVSLGYMNSAGLDSGYNGGPSVAIGANNTNGGRGNTISIGIKNSPYNWGVYSTGSYSVAIGGGNTATYGAIAIGANINNSVQNSLMIGPNDSAKITILSSGNVGIGTSSPGQKLSVVGTIESTSGGFKFPDGTTQTTAAASSNTSGRVTGGCAFGGAWGTATQCSLGAGMSCSAGNTARIMTYHDTSRNGQWNSAGTYANGFCISN